MFDGFQHIYQTLERHGVRNALAEALKLYDLLSMRAISRLDATIAGENPIDLERLARERKKGVPTEYILGKAPFMGRWFVCSAQTLIPRQETELLTKSAINILSGACSGLDRISVIDMGTGCGNIAVSIALSVNNAMVFASDLDVGAIRIARQNVHNYGLNDRIALFSGDLFGPLENQGLYRAVDMIVCNPAYIPTSSIEKLDPQIKNHEPLAAFDGGTFGIDMYRRLIQDSTRFLKKGGILIFEIGVGQMTLVTRLLDSSGSYGDVEYFRDGEQVRVVKSVFHGVSPAAR